MDRREWLGRGVLVVALLASIGSPPSEPGVEQAPLWTASGSAYGESEESASIDAPFHRELVMAFTMPEGGSGGYTTTLSFSANVHAEPAAAWTATLSDEAGNVLDEVEVTESEVAEGGQYFSNDLTARDVLPGCEAEVRCTASVLVDIVPTIGTITFTWQAGFTARDNELGEESEYSKASLSAVEG